MVAASGITGAGITEADDRQVTTVFTVQASCHHRHSTNRVSWSVTIVGERTGEVWLHVRRRWQRFMILGLSSADGGMAVGLWRLSSLDGRRPPWYRPQEISPVQAYPLAFGRAAACVCILWIEDIDVEKYRCNKVQEILVPQGLCPALINTLTHKCGSCSGSEYASICFAQWRLLSTICIERTFPFADVTLYPWWYKSTSLKYNGNRDKSIKV